MVKFGVLDIGGTKYTLKLGETYLVGVKSEDYPHDIEIDDASVDIKHCILDFTDRLPKLFDIRSKCGTFVDGIRAHVCRMIPIVKTTTIQFGNVEATLQLLSESDSGYLEGRLTPPVKDTSEIICNSPEMAASSSKRLKHILKISDTSTPNITAATKNSVQNTTKPISEFLLPTGVPRKSAGSNTSNRSVDSFYIPETQYPVENNEKYNNSISTSFGINKSKETDTDDDFFIPDTQDVGGAAGRLSNYPRVAFENEDVNETVADGNQIPSSQFHICTQDFNGSDEDLNNNSEDILANIPSSLVIPVIRHSAVQIDDFLNENDEEIVKVMSEGSKAPDGIVCSDDAVTPDLIIDIDEGPITPVNRSVSSDANQEQLAITVPVLEQDFLRTQVFVKPISVDRSITKPLPLSCDKENIGPQKDDTSSLPATQVFLRPPAKIKPVALLPPIPPLPPQAPSVVDDDDLPPTQVFQKPVAAAPIISYQASSFSSTLINSSMQLSEHSFKIKCNKLLDSDDDEMDEVIAPDLVKKMRQSLENSEEAKNTPTKTTSEVENVPNEKNNVSTSKEKPITTPKTTKKQTNSRPQPAVSIDNFMYTPDFLKKDFSKNEQLQKLAEKNWKNIISANTRKALLGFKDSDGNPANSESDDSQDSFDDLLPPKHDRVRILKSGPEQPIANVEKPKEHEKPEAHVEGRSTCSRIPSLMEETQEKKQTIRSESDKKESKPKNVSRKDNKIMESVGDKNELELNKDDMKKSRKEPRPQGRTSHSDKDEGKKNKIENQTKTKTTKENPIPTACRRTTRQKTLEMETDELKHHMKKSRKESRPQSPTSHSDKNERKKNKKEDQTKKTKEKSIPTACKRITRQKTLDMDAAELKHHIDSTNKAHTSMRSNSFREKTAVDDPKEPEKKISKVIHDKSHKNKSTELSSTSSVAVESQKGKKEDTKRNILSKELAGLEREGKHLSRTTGLRSGLHFGSAVKTEGVNELTKKKKTSLQETTSKLTEKKTKIIDLTMSDDENTTNSVSPQNPKSMTARNEKRKNEDNETKVKRLRASTSTDSFTSIQSNKIRRSKIRIAMTMCDPRNQNFVEKHSGVLWLYAQDPKECDVLVVEKGIRTYKLMVAMARGIPVVYLAWLEEVITKKTVAIPFEKYIFEDPQFQERHSFSMKNSLHLAKTTHLLKGISFLMTPGIRPIPNEMTDIIICARGTVLEQIPEPQPGQRIYLVSNPSDKQYWYRYRRSNSNIKIVTSEGLMACVMQQSLKPLLESIIE